MPRTIRDTISSPRARRVIICVHLLLILVLYFHQGIHSDKEALKYIGCAWDVLRGDLSDLSGNYLKYSGYVLFLLPFVALGVTQLAVLFQVALGIVAAFALARIVERVTGQVLLGTLAMALLLFCYPVQVWTLALYTESFFTSMTLLFLERMTRKKRVGPASWTIGLFTVFARPVGIFFVVPGATQRLLARKQVRWGRLRWLLYPAILLVAISIPGVERPQLEPIVDAHVIAGVADDNSTMENFTGSSILSAQIALFNRLSFAEWSWLSIRRMASLLTLVRPYYSIPHNALAGMFMLLYPLALFGAWRWRSHPTIELMSVVLLLNIMLVGLTHDEWSGRFMVPLLPMVIGLAMIGPGSPARVATK